MGAHSAKHVSSPTRSGPPTLLIAILVIVLIAIALGSWRAFMHRTVATTGHLTVYYAKTDGHSMGTWDVSTRSAPQGVRASERLHDSVLYAAVQAVAGPPSDVTAVRFPSGTHVLGVSVKGSTATVDLSPEVEQQAGGMLGENGEFQGLVYTVTGVPGITAVQVTVGGRTFATLPGGQFEIDQPLHRSDW